MTKRQMIDEIMTINRSANPGFLAQFDDQELGEYLQHLVALARPAPRSDPGRYEQIFAAAAPVAVCEPAATCTMSPPASQALPNDRWLF